MVVATLVIDDSPILVCSVFFRVLFMVYMPTKNGYFVVVVLDDTEQRSGWCDQTNSPIESTQEGIDGSQ